MKLVRFIPTDAWIFRKPVYFGIGDIAESDIMPPLSVIEGALRTAIGKVVNVDWKKYAEGSERSDVYDIIGYPSDRPPFAVSFPMIDVDSTVYIKLPFNVVIAEKEGRYEAIFIPFDAEVEHIDVKLPKLISFGGREAVSQQAYISTDALKRLFSNYGWQPIEKGKDFIFLSDVAQSFWHTGIRIDDDSYTVYNKGKGHMFRYMGIEFKEGVSIVSVIDSGEEVLDILDKLNDKEVFFGAKGKAAIIKVSDVEFPVNVSGSKVWVLCSGVEAQTPVWVPLFDSKPTGIALQGKYIYTGYDMVKRQGKPSKVMLPVSSTFYFEDGCQKAKKGIFITL